MPKATADSWSPGKVMVLQGGRIRREISYNGDTINTTARIESMCNTYQKNPFISGDLVDLMHDREDYYIKKIGNIRLKEKRRKMDVFHIREKNTAPIQIKNIIPLFVLKKSMLITLKETIS